MSDFTLLHAMLPVTDLDRSLNFYARFFDLHEIRRIELTAPKRSLVFIGADTQQEPSAMQIELWYEPGKPVQSGSGHIGIGVRDMEHCVAILRAGGVPILQEPAALRPGGRVIALIADPDGHEIELLA